MSKRAVAAGMGFVPCSIQRKLAAWESEGSGSMTGLAFADAVEGGDQHGQLRGQRERFADVRVVVDGALRRDRRS